MVILQASNNCKLYMSDLVLLYWEILVVILLFLTGTRAVGSTHITLPCSSHASGISTTRSRRNFFRGTAGATCPGLSAQSTSS